VPNDYHEAANRYRPEQVRVLFLAESPPACDSDLKKAYFFFEENPGGDILFATIVQAALGKPYRKRDGEPQAEVLREFQSRGYWLMDAVDYPINKIDGRKVSDRERKNLIDNERTRLFERIDAIRKNNGAVGLSIVLIKRLVYECLAGPLRQAGYSVPHSDPIGFPSYHGDRRTIKGIQSALTKCNVS